MNSRDVFICHSNKDKKDYVYPFINALRDHGITYWIDEADMNWGDRLIKEIGDGIKSSRYVIVIITQHFLSGSWPQTELENVLAREASKGEVIVLPLLVAPKEIVFEQYPLLYNKLYLKWEEGIESIVTKLSRLLGHEFKNQWVYFHPAKYAGKVWTRIIANPENRKKLHEYLIRWGSWEYKGKLSFSDCNCISLIYTKGGDGLSVPIFLTISPPCYVSFGQGEPLDEHATDVNYGWSRFD